jgi:hypothetical protein
MQRLLEFAMQPITSSLHDGFSTSRTAADGWMAPPLRWLGGFRTNELAKPNRIAALPWSGGGR